ncbi:MAG: type IV pilus secretin PilQ [Betaproteobacteria bacterium]|nr:MAG: type IV pilus secretin PilQ [Betaproteobacteria bacterium]
MTFQKLCGALCAWSVLVLGGMVSASAADNTIDTLNVAPLGDSVTLKVVLKQPLSEVPPSFSVANPARIAFDFLNTANGLGKTVEPVSSGGLRSVNVVQSGDRTRLVLNLNQPMSHEAKLVDGQLYVTLSAVKGPETVGGKVAVFAEKTFSPISHAVRDLNFRRGERGEGRVVVDLSDPNVGIDIRQQGQELVVDFLKATLPDNLRRKFDVADFGTPVSTIVASVQGGNSRLVISPKGLWEHQAYQADNQFVVEVKPVAEDPNKLTKSASATDYGGDRISLNIQNTPIKQLLQTLGEEFGYNVVMSDTVNGSISLRLQNVPWDQAFDLILERGGLDKRKRGNVLLIAPKDELLKKEELELQSKQLISDVEPLKTESFQLNYQRAEAFQKILTDDKQRILSKRGSAVIDPRTNTLFIQDTPSRLEELRKLIAKIDIPVRQVMIEARIVEASDSFSKNLGARLGFNDTTAATASTSGRVQSKFGGSLASTGYYTGQTSTIPNYIADGTTRNNSGTSVNLPATSISGNQPGVFSMILFNPSATRFLNLELSALEVDGKGKVVSSPRVMTSDQTEALIEQGVEIPYQQATSAGATAVAFKKANLSLKVKPQITPDGRVMMSLDINKDVPDTTLAGGTIAIKTKHIKTDVLVDNGGTVVIGGIYEETESRSVSRIPFLGDLPYVGFLFKNTSTDREKVELLVFITPKIIAEGLALR